MTSTQESNQDVNHTYEKEQSKFISTAMAVKKQSILTSDQFIELCKNHQLSEAASVLKKQAPNFIARAEHIILANWFSHLPDEVIEDDPVLQVFWSVAFAASAEQNYLAEPRLLNAKEVFERYGDLQGCIWADIELTYVLYLRQDRTRALEILQNINQDSLTEGLQARFAHAMLLTLGGIDQFDEALEYGQKALDKFAALNDHQTLTRVHRHYSDVLSFQGNFQEGLLHLAQAYEYAKAYKLGEMSFAWLEYSTVNMYIALGDFNKAEQWVDLAEAHLVDQPESPLSTYVLLMRARIAQDRYEFDLAEEYYRLAGTMDNPNELHLKFLLTRQEWAEQAFTLSNQLIWSGKNADSPLLRETYNVSIGLAQAGLGDHSDIITLLQKAADTFDTYNTKHHLASTQIYLTYFYLRSDRKEDALKVLRLGLSSARDNGYFNLEWWQSWIVSEVLTLAIEEQIEPDFVELWAKRRLSMETSQPFLKLVNHDDENIHTQARRILSHLGNPIELKARELLNGCNDLQIKARLLGWLDDDWFTPVGILALKELLGGWRRIEIFLLWCCPLLQAQHPAMLGELVENEEYITENTLKDNIKKIREIFEDAGVILAGTGASALAYDMAVRRGYLNPNAPVFLVKPPPGVVDHGP